MKKSHLKKSRLKSKFPWVISGIIFFFAISLYLAIASGTGPLSFLANPLDISAVKIPKDERDDVKQVVKIPKDERDDVKFVPKATTIPKDERDDVIKPSPVSQNSGSCPAGQQLVTTSTGNQCIPTNGDGTVCGVYAYAQNNKCYKIGDEVSGGYKVCDWTIGARSGVTWAFLSTNCPTKTEVKPGEPKNADECATSKTSPGWWSENENKCVQVGQPITNSPLIVCGAGQRTDKPQYNYPTASTPEVCSSYTAPIVIPPAPAVLSNEELERRQEDCRSSLKKYDIASGACIDLVKCTPVPLTTGAKSYTTCGADGRIEQKFCNNPAGFDANGSCSTTPPVISPTPVTDPKEPKTVIPSPITTSGYIDNIGCSRRYQTTCKEADDGKWYPIVPPVNVPATTPINPIDDRPATPQEEARTKTYNTYLDCTTKTSGLCKADPNDPKKYVFISYVDPTPPKSTPTTKITVPVTPTVPTSSFVQNANGKLDQLVKNQGECKLTGSTYDSEFNLWRCPSADGSVKPPTVSNETGFSAQSPGYNPEKCNLFTGACEEGTVCSNRVFGGYCKPITTSPTPTDTISTNPITPNTITNKNGIVGAYANDPGECKYGDGATKATNGKYACPTDSQANPILDSIPIPAQPVTSPQESGKSVWSQIIEFFTKSENKPATNEGYLDNVGCAQRYQTTCKEATDGKWYPTTNQQLTTPQETNTKEVIVKPPLWSRVMEYFSNLLSIDNTTPPQGFLDNPSCEIRYQADCIEDADGMWYPTFSK